MPKTKTAIAKSEWGMALHTALRKYCDSTPTTIAYNAVKEMQESWRRYLKHIEKAKPDAASIKKASLEWDAHDVPRHEVSLAIILHCAFKLFDDNDWEGYVGYLTQ